MSITTREGSAKVKARMSILRERSTTSRVCLSSPASRASLATGRAPAAVGGAISGSGICEAAGADQHAAKPRAAAMARHPRTLLRSAVRLAFARARVRITADSPALLSPGAPVYSLTGPWLTDLEHGSEEKAETTRLLQLRSSLLPRNIPGAGTCAWKLR